ncbi:MAG TPA: zinc-ribbon domain containing protein [candidate division Zixibacteria bacterium]|nr:zinc-ribbon domain containing protein [candidate division Zixibacteria bacterium]
MGSRLESRILVCTACNEEFVFTVEAQEYFLQKGYSEDPQMCKSCYTDNKRNKRNGAIETATNGAGAPRKGAAVSRTK